MNEMLRQLIVEHLPPDSASVGNATLLRALQERVPGLTPEDFQTVREQLVSEGVLGKGKGRGGSTFLLDQDGQTDDGDSADDDEPALEIDDDEDDEDGFTLSVQDAPSGAKSDRRRRKKGDGPAQVVSYRHQDRRAMNPEVGIVHPENDPDAPKKAWAYDPHLDPALMFDVGRSKIESVIEGALADRNSKAALEAVLDDIATSILSPVASSTSWPPTGISSSSTTRPTMPIGSRRS